MTTDGCRPRELMAALLTGRLHDIVNPHPRRNARRVYRVEGAGSGGRHCVGGLGDVSLVHDEGGVIDLGGHRWRANRHYKDYYCGGREAATIGQWPTITGAEANT